MISLLTILNGYAALYCRYSILRDCSYCTKSSWENDELIADLNCGRERGLVGTLTPLEHRVGVGVRETGKTR